MTDSQLTAILRGLGATAVLCGAGGMMLTMPFLWSSSMENLVGAGFPFVGSSVLLAGGLITLALTISREPTPADKSRQSDEIARLAEARRELGAMRERLEFEARIEAAAIERTP